MSEDDENTFMKRPTEESLKSLIMWPEGTVGYYSELSLVRKIKELCDEHGYGRVPQIAEQVNDIWNNPESVEKYLKQQAKRAELMDWAKNKTED